MSESFQVLPSGGALAAEVGGLDLSQGLPAVTISAVRQALIDHCVLLFRDHSLSETDQVRFTGYFGTPAKHTRRNPSGTVTESDIFVVSNVE